MFCWMCVEAIQIKSTDALVKQLVTFYILAFVAFFSYLFVILPVIYYSVTRRNPYRFYANIVDAMFIAFGASSRCDYY